MTDVPVDVTIERADWARFETVMGKKGGCGGCWCMLWRLPAKQMEAQKGEQNRLAMRSVFEHDGPPGLIALVRHEDGVVQPAGWIQIAERSAFPRLTTSRILKPLDDLPVWSVACFLIKKPFRRQGLSVALLEAACRFARDNGATILEGYPIDTPKPNYPPVYAWTGLLRTFERAGFREVARRSPTRPIMRKTLTD